MIFIIILLITAAVCLALFQPRRAITAAAARHGLAIISAIIATATAVVIRLRRLCHVYLARRRPRRRGGITLVDASAGARLKR